MFRLDFCLLSICVVLLVSSGLLLIVCFFFCMSSCCFFVLLCCLLCLFICSCCLFRPVLHSGGNYQPGHYAPVDNSRRKLLSVASLLYATLTFVGRHVSGSAGMAYL